MAKAKAPAAAAATTTAKPKIDRAARNKRRMEKAAAHTPKVARGTARANRRAAAQKSGLQGEGFPQIWAQYRELELKHKAPVSA